MASLNVESLFTNALVDETIGIILEKVYRNPDMEPLNILEQSLKALLDICMKRAPFTPQRQMYHQKDGVAMGSPLAVLLANFYMDTVEERVFLQHRRPRTYARYIDNIFIQTENSEEEAEALLQQFLNNSILNSTIEFRRDDRLPFLDVLITKMITKMTTTVCTKLTNQGLCLNLESECPARFKTTTIRAFVRRALMHCSSWQGTHTELDRVPQMLVNNGYPNKMISREIKKDLNEWYMADEENKENPPSKDILLFYKSFMHQRYKEEKCIRQIVNENITPMEEGKKLSLVIYYKNHRTRDLVMRNNPAPPAGHPLNLYW
ncbi:uncharacterized protein LOC135225344 [Macrobrachium nipponense]|uniref:uncharacterized protein LOC135225344 n=1 Tax=Macrobrachium nipponense TaxID=159736 RepID=UPI0030C87264